MDAAIFRYLDGLDIYVANKKKLIFFSQHNIEILYIIDYSIRMSKDMLIFIIRRAI